MSAHEADSGFIPHDWVMKPVGEIAPIATGNTPPTGDRSNYGGEFMFVSPVDLGHVKYVMRTEKMLSEKGFAKARVFPAGSVLFVCIGSTIGKCAIASKDLASNQQINAVLPTSSVSSEYMYYALSAVAPEVRYLAGQQAVPIVNKRHFAETEIPLPRSRAEQDAIAATLSNVDALIESLNALLAKKRDIKQAVMQELLTARKRLPGFDGVWNDERLGDLGSTYGGLVGKSRQDFSMGSGRFVTFMGVMADVLIRTENFARVSVGASESQNLVVKGDLLFNGSSETPDELAMCSLVACDTGILYLNSFCFGFRLKREAEADGLYLTYFFRSDEGRKLRNCSPHP